MSERTDQAILAPEAAFGQEASDLQRPQGGLRCSQPVEPDLVGGHTLPDHGKPPAGLAGAGNLAGGLSSEPRGDDDGPAVTDAGTAPSSNLAQPRRIASETPRETSRRPAAGGTRRVGPFELRRVAVGDWNSLLRDPIDVLRGTLLLGAIAMAAAGDYGAAIRLTITFTAVVLARSLDPPRTIDLVFTTGMLLQGWGNALELFELWPWYNKVVHFVLPFGGSAMLYVLLARLEVVHDLDHECTQRQTVGIVVITLAIGFTAGGFYEIWEWSIHHGLDAPIYISYDDTITDMVDNTLGSLAGGIVLALWARRGWGTRRRPALRAPDMSA